MSNAKNRHGKVYCYLVCAGRHSKRTTCTRQAILTDNVKHLIEDYYTRIQITPAQQEALSEMPHHEFDRLMATETDKLNQLTNRRLCNQAFFTKIYTDENDQLHVENNRPSEMLLDPQINTNALT